MFEEAVRRIVSPVILVRAVPLDPDEGDLPVGASKLGGSPDLGSRRWPEREGERLVFVAQINFADVHPHDEDGLLPASGLLSFFVRSPDTFTDLHDVDGDPYEVVYEPDASGLRRMVDPRGEEDDAWPVPSRLTFEAGVDLSNDYVVTGPGGESSSLLYGAVSQDPEWQALDVEEGEADLIMLGSEVALSPVGIHAGDGEKVLLGMYPGSAALPDGHDGAAALLILRADLARADFRRVRLDVGDTN